MMGIIRCAEAPPSGRFAVETIAHVDDGIYHGKIGSIVLLKPFNMKVCAGEMAWLAPRIFESYLDEKWKVYLGR